MLGGALVGMRGARDLAIAARAQIQRRALRDVPMPSRDWHGIDEPELTPLRVLRVGDCSWQAIPRCHTMGEPGYPQALAERLRDRGISSLR